MSDKIDVSAYQRSKPTPAKRPGTDAVQPESTETPQIHQLSKRRTKGVTIVQQHGGLSRADVKVVKRDS